MMLLSGVVTVTGRLSASYEVLVVNVSGSRRGERTVSRATGLNVVVAFGGSVASTAAQFSAFLYCTAMRREELSRLPLKSWAALAQRSCLVEVQEGPTSQIVGHAVWMLLAVDESLGQQLLGWVARVGAGYEDP